MLKRTPAKFYRLLSWVDAEDEAKPIAQQVADAKAKANQKHKDAAKKFPRAPRPAPSAPDYDPADDPGDALIGE